MSETIAEGFTNSLYIASKTLFHFQTVNIETQKSGVTFDCFLLEMGLTGVNFFTGYSVVVLPGNEMAGTK